MKKGRIFVIFAFMILVSVTLIRNTNSQSKNDNILLACLENDNISLFAQQDSEIDGLYTKLFLEIQGKKLEVDWQTLSNPSYNPELYMKDLNDDGVEELVAITTIGTGTGFKEEEIYVLNSNGTLSYNVENPLEIMNQKVESKITTNNEEVDIEIIVDGEETHVKKNANDAGSWNETLGYGSIIDYTIEDNMIKAHIPVAIATTWYIGEVSIQYRYHDGMYKGESEQFILDVEDY